MQDVSNGQERVRTWPRRRKPSLLPKTLENMDKFAQAQMATKFMAPEILGNATVATQGTPLLPRDILTMMLYNRMMSFQFSDGKWRHPLPFRTDVSESLDALGNQPGMTLQRGSQFWEAKPPSQPGVVGVEVTKPAGFTGPLANTWYRITFTDVVVDQAAMWDPAHPERLTAPVDGWYLTTFQTLRSAGSNGFSAVSTLVNGSQRTIISGYLADSVGGAWLNLCDFVYLHAGDYVEFDVYAGMTNRNWSGLRAQMLYV